MKIKILIISIIVLIIGVLIGVLFMIKGSGFKIDGLKKIRFSYSNGYMMDSNINYELENDEYVTKVVIKPFGVSESDKVSFYVDKSVSDKVVEVLNKYNVSKWDGFDGNDELVLDGDSFSMYITLTDGKSISANGYMEWPENYGKVKGELDDIFMELYNEVDR